MERQSMSVDELLQNREQLLQLINSLLQNILSETKTMPRGNSRFHCKDVPAISIMEYLKRIMKYTHCSSACYILALIYIDRFQERQQDFVINFYCIHRLLITAVMIAVKFLDDFYYKNDYYAKIGGISKIQMNALQQEIIKKLDFNLSVSEVQFRVYTQKLINFKEMNSF